MGGAVGPQPRPHPRSPMQEPLTPDATSMTACAGPPAADSSAEPLVPVFDDRRLLAAMRAGAELPAGAVYRPVRPTVDRTLTRLVGARDPDYQDLVQQTMIELIIRVER